MAMLSANVGAGGAQNLMSGIISKNATWAEDIPFLDESYATVSLLSFRLTFRRRKCDDAALTLSTADGTLTIVDADPRPLLRIMAAPSLLSSICGSYISDLVSLDGNGVVRHWAHGQVTFTDDPVLWE